MAKRNNPFWTILSIVLIVALVACGFAFKTEIKALFSGQKLYTKSQYDDAYNQGKKSGEAESKYNYELASGYKKDLEKEKQKSKEKDDIIAGLNKDKQDLTNANNNLTERNEALEGENSRLTDLVNTYEEAMPNYCDENHRTVTYKVGDRVISTSVVEVGATLTEAVEATFPSDCYDTFNYWEINGVQTNPVGYVVNDHTTFVANVTKRYKVYTTISGTRTENIIESLADLATPTEIFDGRESRFNGWKINDELITNLGLIAISNNMELEADFSKLVVITVNWYIGRPWLPEGTEYPIIKTKNIERYEGELITWDDIGAPGDQITYKGTIYSFNTVMWHQEDNPRMGQVYFRKDKPATVGSRNLPLGVYYC